MAGSGTSVLRLRQGGGTGLPLLVGYVTPKRRDQMLRMNTGAHREAHYKLNASGGLNSDIQFRILLAGPGEFHYAVSADSRSNTCVPALPGNCNVSSFAVGRGYPFKPPSGCVYPADTDLVDAAVFCHKCACHRRIPVNLASAQTAAGLMVTFINRTGRDGSSQFASCFHKPSGVTLPGEAATYRGNGYCRRQTDDVHVQVELRLSFVRRMPHKCIPSSRSRQSPTRSLYRGARLAVRRPLNRVLQLQSRAKQEFTTELSAKSRVSFRRSSAGRWAGREPWHKPLPPFWQRPGSFTGRAIRRRFPATLF